MNQNNPERSIIIDQEQLRFEQAERDLCLYNKGLLALTSRRELAIKQVLGISALCEQAQLATATAV